MKNPVELINLGKQYSNSGKSIRILENISFSLCEGEFVSIFGPNGCGKSTLLNIIGGLEHDYSGEIFFYGTKPDPIQIGHVFQNYDDSLFPWMTLLDNVTFGLKMGGMLKQKRIDIGNKALKKLGLEQFKNYYPYQVSGGMKQKTCIARALATECKLFLLDEPFSALDHDTTYRLEADLLDLWQEDPITTIFISHDIEEAVLLSDKIVLLTPRPARVRKIITNPLKRPRNMKMIVDKDFLEVRNEIINICKLEKE